MPFDADDAEDAFIDAIAKREALKQWSKDFRQIQREAPLIGMEDALREIVDDVRREGDLYDTDPRGDDNAE